MSNKIIKINNVDCTSMFLPYGYAVKYKKIRGNNGGVMQDGSTVEDVLAIKAVVTLPCMPWTESEFYSLLSSIYGNKYVNLYYFDPLKNTYRTIECIYGEIQGKHRITNAFGHDIWATRSIELTER